MTLLTLLLAFFMQTPSSLSPVEKQVENLRNLMLKPNEQALYSISSSKLSYGHSSGKVESQKDFVETLVSGKSVFKKIEFKDQTIDIEGNTAVVRHTLLADTFDGGVANSIKIHVVLVWAKEKGTWKLLARQAVKMA